MKKIIWMSIVLFLFMGTFAFAQSWAAFGYQMNLTNVGDGADWKTGHGLKILCRFSMLPINENIGFGFLFSGRFSFPKEADWVNPETGDLNKITDAKSILDYSAFLGASLHGRISGPLGFGIGTGITANWVTAKVDSYYTLMYGKIDLDYNTFDLGLGLNAGLKLDISRFVIEVGTDFSFSFFKRDSYTFTSEYEWVGASGIVKSNSVSGGVSILRVSPYILFGIRF